MRKYLTLIELVVVVVILGVIAAIVIPNVTEQKEKAVTSMMKGNVRSIQTAIDIYQLKNNGNLPTNEKPTIKNPQIINIDALYPTYLKSKPKDSDLLNQYYWVDSLGIVWGSTVKSPSNIFKSDGFIEWNHLSQVKSYNIYTLNEDNTLSKANKTTYKFLNSLDLKEKIERVKIDNPQTTILLSSVDQYGLESAPKGVSNELQSDWFTPIINLETSAEFEITSEEIMHWISYKAKEFKPEGTSVLYEFSIKDSKGDYQEFTTDFGSLEPSKGIKVKVTTKGFEGKYPSVLDFFIFFHYDREEVLSTTRTLVENVTPEGRAINEELPMKVTDSFTAIDRVKEIYMGDTYLEEQLEQISYQIKKPESDFFSPLLSFEEITTGSVVQITREYKSGYSVQVNAPIVITKEKVEYQKPTSTPVTTEWETIQTLSFIASTEDGQIVNWLRAEIDEIVPSQTRTVYKYAHSSGGSYSSFYNSLEDLPSSRSVKVQVEIQQHRDLTDKNIRPTINSIRLHHERGYSDLSLVNPSVVIVPIKNNNKNRDVFSNETIVNWQYEGFDPRNKEIVVVEWAGDKREQYPVGNYTVQARVKNESGYWSSWTSYKFEVKQEKPVAAITMTPSVGITTSTKVVWEYKNSSDPDGDGIATAEWENKKDFYEAGTHLIKMRVQDHEGYWSDWVEKIITVQFIPTFKELAFGTSHGIAVTDTSQVVVWGKNYNGQFGIGEVYSNVYYDSIIIPNFQNVNKVRAGGNVNFAIMNNGDVYSWGQSTNGHLGLGDIQQVTIPTKLSISNVKDIFTSNHRAFALLENGDVYGWGYGGSFAFSSLSSENVLTPLKIDSLSQKGVTKISSDIDHTLALLSTGEVMVWGSNGYSQLGMTATTLKSPTIHLELNDVKDISVGHRRSYALKNSGELYVFGYNNNKTLGSDTAYKINTPTKYMYVENIDKIATNRYNAYLIDKEGNVYSFGDHFTIGFITSNEFAYYELPALKGSIGMEANEMSFAFYMPDGTIVGIGYYKQLINMKSIGDETRVPTYMPAKHVYTP